MVHVNNYVGVIGEALVDVVMSDTTTPRAHPGGSPLNVAVGLARLGETVLFAGRYGKDEYGAVLKGHLQSNRVHEVLAADELPTSVATARLDPTGAATYEFDLDWVLPEPGDLNARFDTLEGQLTHLHFGSIATMLSPGDDVVLDVIRRRTPTATISYDPNCRPSIVPDRDAARAQAEASVKLSDIVHASDEDLEWLYPEQSLEQVITAWQQLGPALVVITRGMGAVLCATEQSVVEQPIMDVEVADTVGCGDSFTSALLTALKARGLLGPHNRDKLHRISEAQLHEVINVADEAAAITSSRTGANPPFKNELKAL